MDVALVPRPRSLDVRSGTVTWVSPLRVSVEAEWRGVVETFARDLATSIGWDLEIVGGASDADVIIRAVDCAEEEFRLAIDEVVTIDAASPIGVAHALAVLRQLGPDQLWSIGATLERIELPRLFIEDGPRFAWRGV
ncbi:MAG TPA: glycoside hydrolase family 20 zincin-like fold domain-containing protein, partial [Acidimicrobiales bacterium]|nr:glycoside hydrolase family 20 zincin-like fold domain-containing protein [Acidimicrobiales bacterium]